MRATYGHIFAFAAAGLCAVAAGPAGTAPAPPAAGHARLMDQLAGCAEVSERDARLACYEAAAAALKDAERRGDLVIVDRAQADAVRRQSFGFNLPSLTLFDRGERHEPMEAVSARLASATREAGGRWTFRLDDGAAWTQVDSEGLMLQPRPGMRVDVRKGMVGSYFLGLDGHAGVRVRRVQ
jgi:hypothetical protein